MRIRRALLGTLVAVAAGAGWVFLTRRSPTFVGTQREAVAKLVSAGRIEEQTASLSRKPHRAGTEANFEVSDLILARLKSAGLKVSTQTHKVDLYEPGETRLTVLAPPANRELDLSDGSGEAAYLAYSPDADLDAEVVYANYGAAEDYDLLEKKGVTVKGRIALVRAQGVCRGKKAEIAVARGVLGLLLFPEPRDQGFAKPRFPEGPNTPRRAVMSGSMLAYYRYPGDPRQARALGIETLPKLPALPLSQENAEVLLSGMAGEAAPEAWKGWLAAPYALARSVPRVRLHVRGTIESKTIKNVFATLPAPAPDAPPVVLGSHYDAWVHGAVDPCSGTAVVLEAAETLARLADKGWKPRRTITFAFWDGEEAGMHGSTKWVEASLRASEGLTAYVNVDSAVRANDFVGNVAPGLRGVLENVLKVVEDPDTGKKLADLHGRFDLPGFSSDVAAFAGLTGTPVAELGFGRWFPVYHTASDSIDWLRRFGDPGFKRSATLARVVTLFVGTLAGDSVVPYQFAEIGAFVEASISSLHGRSGDTTSWLPQQLRNAGRQIDLFQDAARAWDARRLELGTISVERGKSLNALVLGAMGAFGTRASPGTEGREFGLCNALYGPSSVDGCGAEPLAALVRAVASRDRAAARRESDRLERSFAQARDRLTAATWASRGKGQSKTR